MSARTVELTTSAYVRSHMRQPRGHGLWVVQQTTRHTAYAHELVGEPVEITCLYGELRQRLAERGMRGLAWAVLP